MTAGAVESSRIICMHTTGTATQYDERRIALALATVDNIIRLLLVDTLKPEASDQRLCHLLRLWYYSAKKG